MIRTRTAAIAALSLLSLALPASAAAPDGRYKGQTEQGSTLFMTIKKGKITRFSANTRLFCSGGEGMQFRMLYHDRPLRVRNGRFKFEGESEDGATYEFKGAISGRRAKGTLGFHDGSWSPTNGAVFCNANDVKWTAKRR